MPWEGSLQQEREYTRAVKGGRREREEEGSMEDKWTSSVQWQAMSYFDRLANCACTCSLGDQENYMYK